MDIQAILLSAIANYGASALFVAILLASIGVPLPSSFLLVAAGSFITQGEMQFWPVIVAGLAGAVIGDHVGYGIGRLAGSAMIKRVSRRFRAEGMIEQAESTMQKWGGAGIFLTRWLITAVGPYVNLTSGLMNYHLLHFSLWDVIGEALWVLGYVSIGTFFSTQLATISDALGDLTWVAVGVAVIIIIAYKLIQSSRTS
ncbi:MAG: DedA family protein [Caldilineaceae bacterium]